jgi:hypothetical protein
MPRLFCQISDMYELIPDQQQNVSFDTDSLMYMEIYIYSWEIWFTAVKKFQIKSV